MTQIDPIRLDEAALPQLEMKGGPMFSTGVIRTQSGWRQANQVWSDALWQIKLQYRYAFDGDFEQIVNFFLGRRGPAYPFLARDPSDYADDGHGKVLLINGVYRLVKEYPDAIRPYRRIITRPFGEIVVAGVSGSGLALDTDTGIIANATSSGTWQGLFDVPVCFMGDEMSYSYDPAMIGDWQASLEEVRIR